MTFKYRIYRIWSVRDAFRGKTRKEEEALQEGQGQGRQHIRVIPISYLDLIITINITSNLLLKVITFRGVHYVLLRYVLSVHLSSSINFLSLTSIGVLLSLGMLGLFPLFLIDVSPHTRNHNVEYSNKD